MVQTDGFQVFANELRNVAPALPPHFLYQKDAGHIYLQPLSHPPGCLLRSDSVRAWEAIAKGFFQIMALVEGQSDGAKSDVPFLYFLQLPRRSQAQRLRRSGAFDVEASRAIDIDVHTLAAPTSSVLRDPIGEVLFDLSHSATTFTSSRHVRVDSRRDVRTISIATSPIFRRAAGHLSVRTVVFCAATDAGTTPVGISMTSAKRREEIVLARYDFPLKVGRFLPWVASSLVGLAAAIASFKAPEKGSVPTMTYLMTGAAFLVAFVGVTLGLRGDGKR